MKKQGLFSLLAAAVMCVSLAACGENTGNQGPQGGDQQGGEQPALTAETDFDALVSDKVTEAQWDAAFTDEAFAGCTSQLIHRNMTITTGFGYKITDVGYDICFKLSYLYGDEPVQDEMIIHVAGTQATQYRKVGDGYQYASMDISGDEHTVDREWMLAFRMYISYDFAGKFGYFTYDETQHAYTYEGDTLELPYTPIEAMGGYTVSYATLKFSGGKLAYAKVKVSNGQEEIYKYYDYGKTEVTIPTDARPRPDTSN